MAKQTKPAAKPTAEQSPTKLKGPKPDFTPRVKKVKGVDQAEIIKSQPVLYYGESRPIGKLVLEKKFTPYSEGVSRAFAWEVAVAQALAFKGAARGQLSKLATMASKTEVDGGPVDSFQLNKLEMMTMGFLATSGIFTKRIRFWGFMKKVFSGETPENIGETMFSDPIGMVSSVTDAVLILSDKAKKAADEKLKESSEKNFIISLKSDLDFPTFHDSIV